MLGVGRGDAEPLGESLCWKRPKVVWENIRYPETCSNPALCLLLSSLQRLRTCHLLSHGYSQLAARSVWPAHPPQGLPEPSVWWEHAGVRLPAQGRVFQRGHELVFASTAESDAGVYTCRAANLAGQRQQEVNITVASEHLWPEGRCEVEGS